MSEDITPRQPDKLDRLIALVELMNARLERVESRLDSMDARLTAIEGNRDTVGKLDKLLLEVAQTREELKDLKDEVAGSNLQTRADIRDLKRSYLKIEEWIDQNEAQKK